MATALAFEPDVGAEAYDGPFERAARVRFAQAQQIVELEIREHVE